MFFDADLVWMMLNTILPAQGIHVAHVIIDGQIALDRTMAMFPGRDVDSFLSPEALAEQYWQLHVQHKTVWTQEIDVRPYVEKF